jgi:hypothetical protein
MSSLKRGRDMDNQAWYAVLRHRRGNPDTRFAVTYPYCCTLSTLPADGTLALGPPVGWNHIWRNQAELGSYGFGVLRQVPRGRLSSGAPSATHSAAGFIRG